MPKRVYLVSPKDRRAQKAFAMVAKMSHDRERAELYLDADFLIQERERMRERLISIGVIPNPNKPKPLS